MPHARNVPKSGEIVCCLKADEAAGARQNEPRASKFISRNAKLASAKANFWWRDLTMYQAMTKLTSDGQSIVLPIGTRPELRAAQPEVDSTSRRKKVGNLPAPKS